MTRAFVMAPVLLLLAAQADPQTIAPGASAPERPARVSLSAYVYDAEGRVPATNVINKAGAFTLYVYSRRSLCQLTWPAEELPTDAGFGWRVSVRPLESGTGSATDVQVDWQRMWEAGKPVAGPSGTSRFTLRPSDRVPLDSIAAAAVPNGCTGTAMTLYIGAAVDSGAGGASRAGGPASGGFGEMSSGAARTGRAGGGAVGRSGAPAGGGAVGARSGGGGMSGAARAGGSSNGGGSGGAFGREGGVTTGGGVVTFSGVGGEGRVNGAGAGGCRVETPPPANGLRLETEGGRCVQVYTTFDPTTLQTVNLELWLVHTLSSGTEEVQYQKIQTLPLAGKFTFNPVTVEGPEGRVAVEVTGFVQAQKTADGKDQLAIGLIRRLTGGVSPTASAVSGASRIIATPRAGEVVSAEIPDCCGSNRLIGHTFALRLRVVP